MKKETIFGITLSVLALIGLGILAVYLTFQQKDALFSSGPTAAESEADAALSSLLETQAAVPAVSSAPETAPEYPFIIWVGDSRTIGMRDAVKNEDLYIGASGEGYDWLFETGMPQVEDAIETYPDAPVVFNFGVNDYDNLENYLSLYRSLTEEYPGTHFYFLSVNPIDPAVCRNITNEEIADFNSHLEDTFSASYIDSFTYLMANEVQTIDGIHYSKEDYRLIYEFAAQEVSRTELLSESSR